MRITITPLLLRLVGLFFPVKIVKTPRGRNSFTRLWHRIWVEEHYASRDEPIVEKYAKYEEFSIDFLVAFLGVFPVATMRLIWDNQRIGLPTINDFSVKKCWNNDRIMEVTLLTVKRRFRGSFNIPFVVLMRALYRYHLENKVDGIVIAADKRLFFLLSRMIKLPFIQIGEGKFYEGSVTIPAFMNHDDFVGIFSRNNPQLAGFVIG